MRTTLDIDDHVLREAKKLAAERGTTLTAVIESAIRETLRATLHTERTALEMPTVRGRRPPVSDVADRDALYERMEGRR